MVSTPITVLMPVYNASRFLRESIESMLSQTFRNFEFLIIDDGSTDESVSIVREYQDSRIRLLLNEKNIGISETLNRGIEAASSRLIARMDADDISFPDRLEKQYEYMIAHPDCALLSCWAQVITEDKQFVKVEKHRSEYYYFNLTFECWMYHPTIMFRKDSVQQIGMYTMPYSEDYDLFWRMSTQFKIHNLEEELLYYRLSPSSLNTVLKKDEYDLANEQNVIRNIRHYLGGGLQVSRKVLAFLRHDFESACHSASMDDINQALQIIDRVAEKMLTIQNPNRNVAAIRNARGFKKMFIIRKCLSFFPAYQFTLLLIVMGQWTLSYRITMQSVKWRLRRIRSILFAM
jgi:glycosyltransferase involved in cell wall biosynthesis